MSRRGRAVAVVCLAVAGVIASASIASAANTRLQISDYRWSKPEIHVDLGEHVTWYWTGPDTVHSVTGESANALQWDSDPNTNSPIHPVGDSYAVTFQNPGTYVFRCKLHSTVRGEVIVSGNPGDPVTEPDPIPESNVDLEPPAPEKLRLTRSLFKKKTGMTVNIDEAGSMDVDYFHALGHGRRRYAGYKEWSTYIGINNVTFGDRTKHFKPKPGRYVAIFRATDMSFNTSKPQRVRFEIRR